MKKIFLKVNSFAMIIVTLIAMFSIFSVTDVTAVAASYTIGTYTPTFKEGCNVRPQANTKKNAIGAICKGVKFNVSKIENGEWGYTSNATLSNGKKGSGYVNLKYCTKINTDKSEKTYTAYVNTGDGSTLILRKTASTKAAKLAYMADGSKITVLNNKAKTNGFYKVTYGKNTGYAYSLYISFSKPATTNSNTNLSIIDKALKIAKETYKEGSQHYYFPKYKAYQCHGFGCYMMDLTFGGGKPTTSNKNYTYIFSTSKDGKTSKIKPGDMVRYRTSNSYDHTIYITKVDNKYIYYADCNGDGENSICYSRKIKRATLESKMTQKMNDRSISRYGYIAHHKNNPY